MYTSLSANLSAERCILLMLVVLFIEDHVQVCSILVRLVYLYSSRDRVHVCSILVRSV